jgi:hypothetical protein
MALNAWLNQMRLAEYLVIDLETTNLNTLDAKTVGVV